MAPAKVPVIGILGVGKMGEAILAGIQKGPLRKEFELQGSTRTVESALEIQKVYGITCLTQNKEVIQASNILILAVKPHQAEQLLKEEVTPYLKPNQLLISICASLTTAQLQDWTAKKVSVIRAMPNTPCLIQDGMTVFALGSTVTKEQIALADRIFQTLGKTATVDESLMDGVTGLSGCGPAYVYLIIEALSEAGVKVGLSRKISTLLAAQTLKGAARMVLERDAHPAELKDEVTTPAGCTIDGLMALEEGKVRMGLIKAVVAATRRSRLLGRKRP